MLRRLFSAPASPGAASDSPPASLVPRSRAGFATAVGQIRKWSGRGYQAFGFAAVALYVVAMTAAPAGALAPQPIDASEQGPLAFVAMTVMIVIFVLSLFYMDRIRQRREDNSNPPRD